MAVTYNESEDAHYENVKKNMKLVNDQIARAKKAREQEVQPVVQQPIEPVGDPTWQLAWGNPVTGEEGVSSMVSVDPVTGEKIVSGGYHSREQADAASYAKNMGRSMGGGVVLAY